MVSGDGNSIQGHGVAGATLCHVAKDGLLEWSIFNKPELMVTSSSRTEGGTVGALYAWMVTHTTVSIVGAKSFLATLN